MFTSHDALRSRTGFALVAPTNACIPGPVFPPVNHQPGGLGQAKETKRMGAQCLVVPLQMPYFSSKVHTLPGRVVRKGGRGVWTAKTVKRPRQQPAHPQYANYWAPLTRKRHTMPHSAQSRHANYWAPRTRKRHQQEHRPQRPTESSDPTQHAKGRTGDRPGPRKGATTRRNVTQGGGGDSYVTVEIWNAHGYPSRALTRVEYDTPTQSVDTVCLMRTNRPIIARQMTRGGGSSGADTPRMARGAGRTPPHNSLPPPNATGVSARGAATLRTQPAVHCRCGHKRVQREGGSSMAGTWGAAGGMPLSRDVACLSLVPIGAFGAGNGAVQRCWGGKCDGRGGRGGKKQSKRNPNSARDFFLYEASALEMWFAVCKRQCARYARYGGMDEGSTVGRAGQGRGKAAAGGTCNTWAIGSPPPEACWLQPVVHGKGLVQGWAGFRLPKRAQLTGSPNPTQTDPWARR